MVVIGVDPAFRKGGFWACFVDLIDRTARFRQFRDVLEFDRFLQSAEAPERALAVVENSNLQNVTFKRNQGGSNAEVMRKSRNVGTNQAASELTYRAAVDRYGKDNVMNISPERKGTKFNEMYFRAAMKGDRVKADNYTGVQDQRDAYQLARMGMSALNMRRAASAVNFMGFY